MLRSFIDEARKNPESNPRTPAFQQIMDAGYNGKEYFLTFTNIRKVGINPSSGYNTPNGIYAYPAREIMKNVRGDLRNVPFANNSPYINVLKMKGSGILDPVESYSNGDLAKDINNIFKIIKRTKIFKNDPKIEQYFLQIIDESVKGAKANTAISKFWNITRNLSADSMFAGVMGWKGVKMSSFKDHYFDPSEKKTGKRIKKTPYVREKGGVSYNSQGWNNLLRMMGYNAFVDRNATGLLHENEPLSSVFLTTKAFELVDTINNKSYERLTRQSKYQEEISNLQNKRKNNVNIAGKIAGDSEQAFFQIMDSDVTGCDIDFYNGKFYLSGYGSKITRGSFTSPIIEMKEINIYGGSFTGLNNFESCVIHDGEFRDMDMFKAEIIGGDFYNCMFPKVDVISKGNFLKCRFMSKMMIFNSTMSECNLQDCGFAQCKIRGGYLSGSTLDDNVRVRGGCRMDQVKINGGRYSKSFIDRSTIKGGVFHDCRITDSTVKEGELNNVTTSNVKKEGGIWNEDY